MVATAPKDPPPDSREQFRVAEYASLRSEILQGKQFVFERPLLVIFAAAVAVAQLASSNLLVAVAPAFVALMLFNLVFTRNRLHSGARISAYIDAVLESRAGIEWIGWERALRKYRTWFTKTPRNQRIKQRESAMDQSAIPDAMMFYPHLLVIHIAPVLAAVAGSAFLMAESSAPIAMRALGLAITASLVLAAGLFGVVGGYHPNALKRVIEEQRATWRAVFGLGPDPV